MIFQTSQNPAAVNYYYSSSAFFSRWPLNRFSLLTPFSKQSSKCLQNLFFETCVRFITWSPCEISLERGATSGVKYKVTACCYPWELWRVSLRITIYRRARWLNLVSTVSSQGRLGSSQQEFPRQLEFQIQVCTNHYTCSPDKNKTLLILTSQHSIPP